MGTRTVGPANEASTVVPNPWAGFQAAIAAAIESGELDGDRDSPGNVKARKIAERRLRREMRREAQRMTLAKYQKQLERTAQRRNAKAVRAGHQRVLQAADVPERAPERSRPREHRAATRARARSPGGDPEPEPDPPGRTWLQDLRVVVSAARLTRVTHPDDWDWRVCKRCDVEKEREEFGKGCSYCRRCEAERVSEAKRRKAVAA